MKGDCVSDLTVTYKDYKININPRFLDRTKSWDNLEEIRRRIVFDFMIKHRMEKTDDIAELRKLANIWKLNEFKKQTAFNFEPDVNFHRFWELPKCTCPKLDNLDTYGMGMRYISSTCPIHNQDLE